MRIEIFADTRLAYSSKLIVTILHDGNTSTGSLSYMAKQQHIVQLYNRVYCVRRYFLPGSNARNFQRK